jgi:dienelactone hydrolase
MLSAVPPAVAVGDLVGQLTGAPDPELNHDPAADWARIRCPILLQWGADDTSVPVEDSVRRVRAALPRPDRATLRVYPGVEHPLCATVTGVRGVSAEEAMYGFHRFRFGPRVRADLTDWLAATVRPR